MYYVYGDVLFIACLCSVDFVLVLPLLHQLLPALAYLFPCS